MFRQPGEFVERRQPRPRRAPAREPDAIARLQLTQALQRAKYAIAWERAWPHLARLLTVVGLFLVVSWAGLWLALPFVARASALALFAGRGAGRAVPAGPVPLAEPRGGL